MVADSAAAACERSSIRPDSSAFDVGHQLAHRIHALLAFTLLLGGHDRGHVGVLRATAQLDGRFDGAFILEPAVQVDPWCSDGCHGPLNEADQSHGRLSPDVKKPRILRGFHGRCNQ
ncbi:hypothetical protein [Massilia sp. WF1]|uniref:hypothetical protein n=1 Tax=Massilia sp. WF1 TaxID=1406431 RepID=UPI000B177FCE|nr:hypothetical protein [Massilia sp. WF1]